MIEPPTLAELLGAVIVLGGLLLSGWALVDDAWDLVHVRRFGEVGGPRWVSGMDHLVSDLSSLGAWTFFLVVISIAIYLPQRTDQPGDTLSAIVGWCRFFGSVCFLAAQANRRVSRIKLQNLPLEAWERMMVAMFEGMSPRDQVGLRTRLLTATMAGREIGHTVANDLQLPVAVLDAIADDPSAPPERRAEAAEALAMIEQTIASVRLLHARIKSMEPSP